MALPHRCGRQRAGDLYAGWPPVYPRDWRRSVVRLYTESVTNRREFLALSAVGAVLRSEALAQQGAAANIYRDYSRCLPDYLRDLAERAYQTRNRAIARLTTPAAIRERQQWVAATFWSLNGGMPERTPLNARTVG